MADHKALIAEARTTGGYVESELRWLCGQLADALESAFVERAVVEAQALEQAAEIAMDYEAEAAARRNDSDYPESHIGQWYGGVARGAEDVALRLRARAVEIREGRQ